jgi:enoyl-CoA hydratase/carnithine racemase
MYKLVEMEFTGSRLTAYDCQEHHIVHKACHLNTLMDDAIAFAETLNKDRSIVKEMKGRLNKEIVRIIDTEDVPFIESGQFNIKA